MPRPTGQGIDKDTRRVIKKTGAQFDASSRHVKQGDGDADSYPHLRTDETGRTLVCRLLLEIKKTQAPITDS